MIDGARHGERGRRQGVAAPRRGPRRCADRHGRARPGVPRRVWAAGADRIHRQRRSGPDVACRGAAAAGARHDRPRHRGRSGGEHAGRDDPPGHVPQRGRRLDLGAQGGQPAGAPRGRAARARSERRADPLCGLLPDALCGGLAHRARGQQPARPDRSGQPRGRARFPAPADHRRRASRALAGRAGAPPGPRRAAPRP